MEFACRVAYSRKIEDDDAKREALFQRFSSLAGIEYKEYFRHREATLKLSMLRTLFLRLGFSKKYYLEQALSARTPAKTLPYNVLSSHLNS